MNDFLIRGLKYQIAFFQCCRDRLFQLNETLRHNLKSCAVYDDVLITIVDYGCPNNTADWVLKNFSYEIQNGNLAVLHVDTNEPWRMATVKNISGRLSCLLGAQWLMSLDVDNWISESEVQDFYFFSKAELCFHGLKTKTDGSCGRIGMPAETYLRLNGFREDSPPVGRHDVDLVNRLLIDGNSVVRKYPHKSALYNSLEDKLKHTEANHKDFVHICKNWKYEGPVPLMPTIQGNLYFKNIQGKLIRV